jgi:hypothetical protein
MTSHSDVLARAAGYELSIDQATDLLAPATRIPAQADVVDAVANLWIDYILLTTAAVQDSTLAQRRSRRDRRTVLQSAARLQAAGSGRCTVDTVISEDELRRIFAEEQPNAEVRARHILFRLPTDASPQVRDSVVARARQVIQEARGRRRVRGARGAVHGGAGRR